MDEVQDYDETIDEDKGFDSKFNGGIAKIYRTDLLLKGSHKAHLEDDHIRWKTCLDALYLEVWAYLDGEKDKKELLIKIESAKLSCKTLLFNYLKYLKTVKENSLNYYDRQTRQADLEESLEDYEKLLFKALRFLNMDMPKKMGFDIENI